MHYRTFVFGNNVEEQIESASKWFCDWFVIGGRWKNYLLLRDGSRGNSSTLAEIDIETMRSLRATEAEIDWETAFSLTQGKWISQKQLRQELNWKDEDGICEPYFEQNAIKILRSSDLAERFYCWDQFLESKATYAQRQSRLAFSPGAYIREEQFIELSWDREEELEQLTVFDKYYDSLPNDTMLTIVDCHL